MSNDYELKKKLASMLGVSVLATSLSILPVGLSFLPDGIGYQQRFAKDGDSGEGGEMG